MAYIYVYIDMGCDFARALAVVSQSIPVCNHPDTCDIACMLHTLLWMLFLPAMYANISFKAFFEALDLFSNMPLYGHVVAILILTNCYEILIL